MGQDRLSTQDDRAVIELSILVTMSQELLSGVSKDVIARNFVSKQSEAHPSVPPSVSLNPFTLSIVEVWKVDH
jgi:hypothetical protein